MSLFAEISVAKNNAAIINVFRVSDEEAIYCKKGILIEMAVIILDIGTVELHINNIKTIDLEIEDKFFRRQNFLSRIIAPDKILLPCVNIFIQQHPNIDAFNL